MKHIIFYALSAFLILTWVEAPSQNYIQKNLENIKPQLYGGDIQIWDIEAGDEEYMFFATGNALSVWDGTRWESYFHNHERYFRSLCYDKPSKRLYASGNNTFGYWIQNNQGRFDYIELYYNSDLSNSDIFWRSIVSGSQVYFQTHEKIYRYDNQNQKFEPLNIKGYINYIHRVDDLIYVQIDSKFYEISGMELRALPLEIDSRVVYMKRYEGVLYLFSETKGVFMYENGRLTEGDKISNKRLTDARVFSANSLDAGNFIVGTVLDGLYIVDKSGKIIKQYGEDQAMDYTTVLSLATDSLRNIWIGLDGAIAKIDANPRQSYYNSLNKKIGSVYSLCQVDGKLYLGTNKGLYIVSENRPLHFIVGTEGQVWDIKNIGNEIIVSHDKGLLRIVDERVAETIYPSSWKIQSIRGKKPGLYYTAVNDGFVVLEVKDGKLSFRNKVENYTSMFNNSYIDKYGYMWVNGSHGEVLRVSLDGDFRRAEENKPYSIPTEEGNWISFCLIDEDVVFFYENRCYTYDIIKDRIEANPYYTSLFETAGSVITSITQNGNHFFYISQDDVGIIERSGDQFINNGLIFRSTRGKMIPLAFRKVMNTDSNGKVAMGYENGVAFYETNVDDVAYRYPIRLKRIEYTLRGEKLALDLTNFPYLPNLDYGVVSIRFLLNNIAKDGVVYLSLDGEQWRSARVEEAIEFPYIKSGSHKLRIKRSLQFEHQIEINFTIDPPFTSTIGFWGLVILGAILIIITVYWIYWYRLKKIRKRIMERQAQIIEREKMDFENQKLSLELKDRDKRLTSFAMNSIRFNNTLNDIEGEIREIKTNDPIHKGQLRDIIRKITAYRRSENNWAIFEKYFNNVYDGFFDKLSRDYPNLTQNDMKIAAYIKLGLSTKEIAVLMTISPGSVDTARHRLRKNLGLTTETSITEFLSKI